MYHIVSVATAKTYDFWLVCDQLTIWFVEFMEYVVLRVVAGNTKMRLDTDKSFEPAVQPDLVTDWFAIVEAGYDKPSEAQSLSCSSSNEESTALELSTPETTVTLFMEVRLVAGL